ncbi:MAG TPA: hypothetical protein VFX15_05950 [Actinomycetes bacterium]|nr:hypothetical protein [Actinomycetes bacterium]
MKKTATFIAALALVAASGGIAAAVTLVTDPNNRQEPFNRGISNVKQLLHDIPNDELHVLRSECFIGVDPLRQAVPSFNNASGVFSAARLACHPDELRFSEIEWKFTMNRYLPKRGITEVVLEDTDSRKYSVNPWEPQGGTMTLGEYRVPCDAIVSKPGVARPASITLEVTLWDTEGMDWAGRVVDVDNIVCPVNK